MFSKTKENSEKLETIIGENTFIEGSFESKGTIKLDGKIEGEIVSEGNIIVGSSGKIEGSVKARNVLLSGVINGNIWAEGKVELSSTGRLQGDLQAAKLVIEEGAVFEGSCSMQHTTNSKSNA